MRAATSKPRSAITRPRCPRCSPPATSGAASRWSSGPSAKAANAHAPSTNSSWAGPTCRGDPPPYPPPQGGRGRSNSAAPNSPPPLRGREGWGVTSRNEREEGHMAKRPPEPKIINAEDINPRHQWDRPIMALGPTAVDFEERVDFRRLHRYRLARTRQALAESGLGAVLCFDQYNIRYISSTVIGEWARDKLIRYCLLTGNGEPWVWDFGSAARHHRIYCPWLREDHVLAGNPGMRGAIGPEVGLFKQAAKEIKEIIEKEGVA